MVHILKHTDPVFLLTSITCVLVYTLCLLNASFLRTFYSLLQVATRCHWLRSMPFSPIMTAVAASIRIGIIV